MHLIKELGFYYYRKYTWFVLLKDKKGATIVNAFQNILDDSIKLNSMRKLNET